MFHLCIITALHLYLVSCNLALEDGYRYLREDKPHGSAGGLYNFQDLLMEDDPVSSDFSYHFVCLQYILFRFYMVPSDSNALSS